MKNRAFKVIILVIIAVIALLILSSCGNRSVGIDPYQTFQKAYINLGGEWKMLSVQNWRDYEGDVVQIVSNGVPYVTSYVNVVLIGK